MSEDKLVELFKINNKTPISQIIEATKQKNLKRVIICGYDKDDRIYIANSNITREKSLYLLETVKLYIMRPEQIDILEDD